MTKTVTVPSPPYCVRLRRARVDARGNDNRLKPVRTGSNSFETVWKGGKCINNFLCGVGVDLVSFFSEVGGPWGWFGTKK